MTNFIIGRNSTQVATAPSLKESTIVDNTKFFDWNEKGYGTQPLTLEMLERTQHENDVQGNPLKGIYHYALINEVLGMCQEFGYQTEIYDLFAAQNRDKNMPGVTVIRQVEEQFGEKAVEAHILRRVFANIRIANFDDAETTTGLAIAYHQKGIQVGFGPQVKICHNQCMLSPELYIASYGDKGTGRGGGSDIETILSTVRTWLMNAQNIIETDRRKIERLKNIEVPADQMLMIIGALTAMRVKADTQRKTIRANMTYPLNQSQITIFTEDMLEAYELRERVTAWDIYNSATEMYKANRMDIPQLLPQNRAMVAFLNDWFQLG